MKIKIIKIFLAAATLFCGVGAQAAFENAQTGLGVASPDVQVSFTGATLKDVLLSVVPSSWSVLYAKPSMEAAVITVKGSGSWDLMASQAAAAAGYQLQADAVKRSVMIAEGAQNGVVLGQKAGTTNYTVSRADKTVRETLVRWSKLSGWTHDTEHWALDRDIPIAGAADLGADFKAAVRQLLKSTELSDKPAKPCFYSNSVVRVIALNDTCTRSQ